MSFLYGAVIQIDEYRRTRTRALIRFDAPKASTMEELTTILGARLQETVSSYYYNYYIYIMEMRLSTRT